MERLINHFEYLGQNLYYLLVQTIYLLSLVHQDFFEGDKKKIRQLQLARLQDLPGGTDTLKTWMQHGRNLRGNLVKQDFLGNIRTCESIMTKGRAASAADAALSFHAMADLLQTAANHARETANRLEGASSSSTGSSTSSGQNLGADKVESKPGPASRTGRRVVPKPYLVMKPAIGKSALAISYLEPKRKTSMIELYRFMPNNSKRYLASTRIHQGDNDAEETPDIHSTYSSLSASEISSSASSSSDDDDDHY